MTLVYDDGIDRMLGAWKIIPPRAGFADMLAERVLIHPQRQNLLAALKQHLSDVVQDLFGSEDNAAQSSHWRLAGAMAAILIGFASGYMLESPFLDSDASDMADIYELDEAEPADII
jgi:hypothetical protein